MFERVRAVVAGQLEIDPQRLALDTTFEEIEADSLDVVEIIMALEDEFDIEIPDEKVENIKTLQQVVDYIRELIK
ncbi:MAG: acyl carrier protein [Syntrophomonadaceae bacterium]|nr:acyl carrier protein [Syntrophomonadaceae bacterium]